MESFRCLCSRGFWSGLTYRVKRSTFSPTPRRRPAAARSCRRGRRVTFSPLPLQGGAGAVDARMLSTSVHFRLGSRVIETSQVVIAPLDQLELRHQMEIAGVLGYPALRDSVLTVNYRDSLVDIAGK